MKRLILPLLLVALLWGCAGGEPETVPTTPLETGVPIQSTEPAGFYHPDGDLEILTGGAVREYSLEDPSCYALDMADGDVLVFSGTKTSTLTRLTGENLYPIAQAQLDCFVHPEDPSFQASDKGFIYYDEAAGALVFLDNDLKEVNRVKTPAGIQGSPVLSGNRLKLYYCTRDAVRVLNLETGLDRLLKQVSYQEQMVVGTIFRDTVLHCRIRDEKERSVFISTETGELLDTPRDAVRVTGAEDRVYSVLSEGVMDEAVFGTCWEDVQMLAPADPFGTCWFLEETHTAVTSACTELSLRLDHYDLESGRRTSLIELPGEYAVMQLEPSGSGTAVYGLAENARTGGKCIFRWDLEKTSVIDQTQYVTPWYTLEAPDTSGLAVCAERAASIGARYGVDILVGTDAAAVQPWDYEMEPEYRVPVIQRELNRLEKLLETYPPDFFATMDEDIRICLVRSLRGSAESGSLETANGIQFWDSEKAYVILTVGDKLEQTLYHELFHVADNYVLSACNAYYDWERLNPEGFTYDFDYLGDPERDTIQYLQDETRSFIDEYSMSFPKEDRARIMEYAATPGNESFFRSETMQRKLLTLCQGIRIAFDLRQYPNELVWEQYLEEPLYK